MDTPLETDDAIVLVVGAPSEHPTTKGRIEGVTRLEKLLFLLERETKVGKLVQDAGFVSHHYGPFSVDAYHAVDILAAAGLLTDTRSLSDAPDEAWETQEIIGLEGDTDPYATRDFALTELGRRYYTALLEELPEDSEAELTEFKERFAALPLRQLVRYVYQQYPEYTDKSKIKYQVLD